MSKKCNTCGRCFERIGGHYRYNRSHEPNITDRQHDILTGLLMGDGWVHRHTKTPSLKVSVTERDFIEHIYDELEPLSMSVNKYDGMWCMSTTTHSKLQQYSDWYGNDGQKRFPENLCLNKVILKYWYCCDGSLVNNKSYKHINIGMSNERERAGALCSMFKDVGLPEPRVNKWSGGNAQLVWKKDESEQLLRYMGSPIEGYEYKWKNLSDSRSNC
jgi:hypothetical protein